MNYLLDFLIGTAGGLLCLLAFLGGICFGRQLPAERKGKELSAEMTEEEKIRSEEEMKAYRDLFGYSPETAYGSR